MKITEMLLTPNKYSRPQIPLTDVKKIAVHYVGNPMSTAKNNRDYFENLKNTHARYVSAHFIIGLSGEVIQCIPLNEWSYCTNQANGYSISIECCHPDKTGKFNRETEESLIALCAYLCGKFGLSENDIIRHYDVTGKACPLWYVSHPENFEAMKKAVGMMLSGEDKKMYCVQAGAFSSKDNAERFLSEIRKNYPNAFIKEVNT